MKAFGTPPPGVVTTGLVVLMLFGEKVSTNEADKEKMWKNAVKAM